MQWTLASSSACSLQNSFHGHLRQPSSGVADTSPLTLKDLTSPSPSPPLPSASASFSSSPPSLLTTQKSASAAPGPSTCSSSLLGLSQNDDRPRPHRSELSPHKEHKSFFAINFYNSFDVIPDVFATLFRVASILGYHNVFVAVYENGSNAQTKARLRIFDALARSVGMRVMIRTSQLTRGQFNHHIEYLAEVCNSTFVPLHELRDTEGEYFDTIIFMDNIFPCVDDLLELIWQSRKNNAGITCTADYMYHNDIGAPVFYNNWIARDTNGTALENAPFERIFHHQESSQRFQRHLPTQVQSCWNGIAVPDPAPFYPPPYVRFRMARITKGKCSASECSLICNDHWEAGYGWSLKSNLRMIAVSLASFIRPEGTLPPFASRRPARRLED
ncbi:Alpha-1,3-mannosyltransferase CMT1 [Leucoagaricus sp. SymC.cos]|nr:Alpha-1,3-mannosyltransferase CMT1 [Leucoagaricus sp. SymC.cos]